MLAVLTTHPIQYQVPVWKALAARGRVPLKVYYLSDHGYAERHDPGFGRAVAWDIDLLSGYEYTFVGVSIGSNQASFWWLRLIENIARRAKAEGAKVLWLQGWQVAAYWQAVLQARGQRMELWLRGETNLMSARRTRMSGVRGVILTSFLHCFDKCLYIGRANREFYTAKGIPNERLVFAPYCVENDRFATQAKVLRPRRSELRSRWCIPPNAFCVLFVGKLITKKRPLDLIAAMATLGARGGSQPLHILFVGSGELGGMVRATCHVVYDEEGGASTLSESVDKPHASFAGFLNQSEIAAAYVAADCLVLPSDATETWGLVVNEAMACGLPAVVSDAVGCVDDIVRPVRPDLCFPLGEIDALVASIEGLMRRAPTKEELLAVIQNYDVCCTVDAVEALYSAHLNLSRQCRG